MVPNAPHPVTVAPWKTSVWGLTCKSSGWDWCGRDTGRHLSIPKGQLLVQHDRGHSLFQPLETSLNKPPSKEEDSLGARVSNQFEGDVLVDEAKK